MISAFGIDHGDIAKSGSTGGKEMSRKEIRAGQALNVVATVGGLNAMRMATKEFKSAVKNPVSSTSTVGRVGRAMQKVPGLRTIAKHPKAAVVGAAGAALGLHSAELTGDAIAARSLHYQYKKAPK